MRKNFCIKIFMLILCAVVSCSLCACRSTEGNSSKGISSNSYVSKPEKIVEEIKNKCTLPEMKAISEEQLFTFYGINKEDVAYFSAVVASDSISKDEVAVFEAMDEGEADTICDRLQEHYDAVLSECDEYLPDEYKVVKSCSVVKNGIFVRLFISAEAEKMDEIYNSYF